MKLGRYLSTLREGLASGKDVLALEVLRTAAACVLARDEYRKALRSETQVLLAMNAATTSLSLFLIL